MASLTVGAALCWRRLLRSSPRSCQGLWYLTSRVLRPLGDVAIALGARLLGTHDPDQRWLVRPKPLPASTVTRDRRRIRLRPARQGRRCTSEVRGFELRRAPPGEIQRSSTDCWTRSWGNRPRLPTTLAGTRADILAFTGFPRTYGQRSGSTTPPSGSTRRSAAPPPANHRARDRGRQANGCASRWYSSVWCPSPPVGEHARSEIREVYG